MVCVAIDVAVYTYTQDTGYGAQPSCAAERNSSYCRVSARGTRQIPCGANVVLGVVLLVVLIVVLIAGVLSVYQCRILQS